MILLATLLALQAAPTGYHGNLTMDMEMEPPSVAAAVGEEGDLTVTAKRIYRARMTTRTDRATRTKQCVLKRALGIPAIDTILCPDLLTCMRREPTRRLIRDCMVELVSADIERLRADGQRSR